ncbi:MAG: phosphomannomutase [Polyangiaceae bacterium]|nr:phosphomannomutase [Polyangiaceae bacterium]
MEEPTSIQEVMTTSGVQFGTSGARGLVVAMTDWVCFAYTRAFLQVLRERGELPDGTGVAIGGDRRPSTPRIMGAVAAAIRSLNCEVIHLGLVPSPVVALYGLRHSLPTVMITGSHIPDDRNGMKFTTAQGEITKRDEVAIKAQSLFRDQLFDSDGNLIEPEGLPTIRTEAREEYLDRYKKVFGPHALAGLRLAVYGHSAVGRELFVELYRALGAQVETLGWSESFVPVDTEAIRPEDVQLARTWAAHGKFDAILSSDGDSDRPLTSDERGEWLRGDVTGILTARFLGADSVVTPVSSNGALEISKAFLCVRRTKIGSPFVIEEMQNLADAKEGVVVGYEANGGFLHSSDLSIPSSTSRQIRGGILRALPTRDAVLVHLAVLLASREQGKPISELVATLPQRFTASGRDQQFPTQTSLLLLERLQRATNQRVAEWCGLDAVAARNTLDGVRISFSNGDIIHWRPSGNAPELRCYAEASSTPRAEELVEKGLQIARRIADEQEN